MFIYAHVDGSGNVVNRARWDGVTPYTPPEGIALIQDTNGESWIGGTWDGANFSPMPATPPPPPLTQEQREAQAIQFQMQSDAARKLGLTAKADALGAQAQSILAGGS